MQNTTRKHNFTKMSLYPPARHHMYYPRKCDVEKSKASSVLMVDMHSTDTVEKNFPHSRQNILKILCIKLLYNSGF